MKQYEIKHSSYPWGRNAFSSFSVNYSPNPEFSTTCSSLNVESTQYKLLSIQQQSQLFVSPIPVLLLSLDNCVAFANFQSSINLLTILPEKSHPVQKFVYEQCPKAYDELLEVLSIMWDFAEHDNVEAFSQKNEYLKQILMAVQSNINKLDMEDLQLQLQCHGQNRPLATFEQQIIKFVDEYRATKNENLKIVSIFIMFMERVYQKSSVFLIDVNSPVILGSGEYFAIDTGKLLETIDKNMCSQQEFNVENVFPMLKMQKSGSLIKTEAFQVEIQHQQINFDGKVIKFLHLDDKTVNFVDFTGDLLQFAGSFELNGKKYIVPIYAALEKATFESWLMTGMIDDQIGLITVEKDKE